MTEIDKLADTMRDIGLPAEVKDPVWLEIRVPAAYITVQQRPLYCNRGRFMVIADTLDVIALDIDWADGFPRYYFGVEACAEEVKAWMQARKILPT